MCAVRNDLYRVINIGKSVSKHVRIFLFFFFLQTHENENTHYYYYYFNISFSEGGIVLFIKTLLRANFELNSLEEMFLVS